MYDACKNYPNFFDGFPRIRQSVGKTVLHYKNLGLEFSRNFHKDRLDGKRRLIVIDWLKWCNENCNGKFSYCWALENGSNGRSSADSVLGIYFELEADCAYFILSIE